ncbi:MAG: tRNA uridine-5-carboxymethylaminomethyl(34) synthesis GTPase MnmE [Christensenellaceae bacterium]|jgi:tRNA modification GTPase|nr:tRNA uridine-5-carboxymethylaminomethyl(34) synthesis GTPase MnmE [Christensenellaceae bacterium]
MNKNTDTIMACATPLNAIGAIGIIRISGGESHPLLAKIFKPYKEQKDCHALMQLGEITTKNFKDKCFAVKFYAPNSYTGEDMAEIQFHGGVAIARGVLRSLSLLGCRIAEPGEFTKRSFLNNKLTLNEAEGIADIINAQSESHAMQAYRMLSGEFSKIVHDACKLLLDAIASVDVILDYPEETSIEDFDKIIVNLKSIEAQFIKILDSSANRRYIEYGINVVIAGMPNTGKSSLLNAIIKDERAIVTEIPGTTRDILKESIEIDGVRINFIDTAGIHDSSDVIEQIGIDRALVAIKSADIVLVLTDLSESPSNLEKHLLKELPIEKTIKVGNKSDIKRFNKKTDINVSAKTGCGIDELIICIFKKLQLTTDVGYITRERHLELVTSALQSIRIVLTTYTIASPDIIAEELKEAYRCLTEITGENATESVIDKIFSTFCVGK